MIKNDFVNLISQNKQMINIISLGCFEDSVKCFDSGIYRQAYILAFQGFIQHLRQILQTSKMPIGYDNVKWEKLKSKLEKDNEFENAVFNCIQQKNQQNATPPTIAVLDIPDEVRDDFIFWRNRRNDCAHYKSYDINQSHVLAFYSLLNQYLFRISVEGGRIRLINEFKDALDERKTSPIESLQPLIDKILIMVSPNEMDLFFNELYPFFIFNERFYNMLNDILNGNENIKLKDYIVSYLKNNDVVLDFLIHFPQNVGHLVSKQEAREFWYTKLVGNQGDLSIVANMLKLGLINLNDISECLEKSINLIFDKKINFGNISDEDMKVLIQNGFVKALVSSKMSPEYTSKNAYSCGTQHYEFMNAIAYHLPINIDTIKMVFDIFNQHNYPSTWADIYETALNNSERGQIFDKICRDEKLKIPTCINRK